MNREYQEFLERKIVRVPDAGFDVKEADLNKHLFDFQRWIVKTALKKGRYAIFADCGLGKTLMQLEFANQVVRHTGQSFLILAPLNVVGQTLQEAKKFGIETNRYEQQTSVGVYITNYEMLEHISIKDFAGVVLDESSILKNFTGVYKNRIIEMFAETPYKLACTATPSPNDLNELGNHSEFLDVLDTQDMRTKWFVRDEGMNNYRLKKHAERDFFSWVSSWAVMLSKPSDIGFSADGYDLPELHFHSQVIKTKKKNNGKLFNDTVVSATTFNQELRITLIDRMDKVADIVNGSDESFIIWVNQDAEADKVKQLVPDAVEVRGSDKPSVKEQRFLGFGNDEFRVLLTKTKMGRFGLNYQHCHNQVFAALDFSFENLYQAIRRSYRFGQKHPVHIYLITTDTMGNVIQAIKRKEEQHKQMQKEMIDAVNKAKSGQVYGLKTQYDFREFKTDEAWLMQGDSTQEIKRLADDSIDLIVYSPPFSSLFTYSNYIHDMGNNESDADFFEQYSFLLKELYRVLRPGRLIAVHTKDLARYKNSSGFSGLYNFTGEHHTAMENAGFKYHSKVTIWTDPVLEMQRTKTQRLLYKQLTTDSSYSGIGMSEYVTIFRKWEGNEEDWKPIENINRDNFPLDIWQQWASPVWMDIRRTDVLNGPEGTAQGDEKHICPLQLDVIHRLVNLYSNKGETVFTPFLGIGSEPYVAIKNERKAIGIELKDSYFDVAVKNVQAAIEGKKQVNLFDAIAA